LLKISASEAKIATLLFSQAWEKGLFMVVYSIFHSVLYSNDY
jgi:hypothetical protein